MTETATTQTPAAAHPPLSAPSAFQPADGNGYQRVLLKLSGEAFGGGSEEAARSLAMHIAAARPRYLSRDEVPAEAVETERRVAEQTAKEEGKPEQAIVKIVEGRVNAYYKDFVLLEQPSITEPKRTVKQIVDEAGMTVERFARFEVGQA